MKKFTVTGVWIVEAESAADAENLVENAVCHSITNSELDDCNAEDLEDDDAIDDD